MVLIARSRGSCTAPSGQFLLVIQQTLCPAWSLEKCRMLYMNLYGEDIRPGGICICSAYEDTFLQTTYNKCCVALHKCLTACFVERRRGPEFMDHVLHQKIIEWFESASLINELIWICAPHWYRGNKIVENS